MSGDNYVAPLDALLVINALNASMQSQGEPASTMNDSPTADSEAFERHHAEALWSYLEGDEDAEEEADAFVEA